MPFIIMATIIIICGILTLCYTALMLVYLAGWLDQPIFCVRSGFVPTTSISVIIPARNEEKNIAACITSILKQKYLEELLEIIVVDDHSTDKTVEVVRGFKPDNVRCISLEEHLKGDKTIAYKKKALAAGISVSKGELIVTTDADCTAPGQWLLHIAALYEKERPVMIVAPVDYTSNGSLLQAFQSLDFMSMQGITVASHRLKLGNMSNGANLTFSREAYETVEGYKGVDHLASGDDYLLMMKLSSAFPGRISYLKSKKAIIKTAPQPDTFSFLQQRIRWASKSGKYNDGKMTGVLSFVYLYNLSFVILAAASSRYPVFLSTVSVMLVVKTLAELIYLYPVSKFFNKTRQLLIFPFLQPFHITYIVIAGFLGFIGVYRWKGRRVR